MSYLLDILTEALLTIPRFQDPLLIKQTKKLYTHIHHGQNKNAASAPASGKLDGEVSEAGNSASTASACAGLTSRDIIGRFKQELLAVGARPTRIDRWMT